MTGNPRTIIGPHFITTSPTLTTCRHCTAPILAATVGGIDRHIDAIPLTLAGELAALLDNRATYDLAGALRDHLIHRNAHRIRTGQRAHPVVADHTCRPIHATHVDHTHLRAAAALVRELLGGQVITDTEPPY